MMGIELWVVLAIAAALAQTTRNAVAQTISATISPALNSWSRFTFCLPFAAVTCAVVIAREGLPSLSSPFFFFCLCTAITQLLGNVALVTAFRVGSFGESIVFHKLEVILTALAGAIWFAEFPSAIGTSGIVICALGVVVINLSRTTESTHWTRVFRFGRAGGFALLCAVLLVMASFALKAANTIVITENPGVTVFESAVQTLFHTTWIEVALLSFWIGWREPQSFRAVPVHWRRMLIIGSTGFTASLGWFWAFSLTLVAYVKAVGQIEALIAVALGIRMMGERELIRQLPGILLVVLGISFVLLG
jgi:drug/metabolite transporter (DMT)-like permease